MNNINLDDRLSISEIEDIANALGWRIEEVRAVDKLEYILDMLVTASRLLLGAEQSIHDLKHEALRRVIQKTQKRRLNAYRRKNRPENN